MNIRFALPAAVLTLAALPAMAQSDKPAPPLKGPTVKDGSVPGENRSFAGGGKGLRDRAQQETPHRLFMAALNALRGEKADTAMRLSPEQDEKLRAIDREFQASVEAYKTEHAAEFRDLVANLPLEDRKRVGEFFGGRRPAALVRPNAPQGEPMDAMKDADPKAVEAARGRLRELIAGAPQPSEVHAKMYAVLSESQRPAFQAELERLKKDMLDRRAPGKVEKQVDKKSPDAAKDDGPMRLDDPRIPEAARERIKALPPDQQREAFRKLRERLRNTQPK
ncbi:MAG: hypothetical protein HBSAPP03_13950 [Phycisphaerae bacterium]|nr:MAG: hypothetical protein HBSAPP03_13950 [Phycisphaerae bacterium]